MIKYLLILTFFLPLLATAQSVNPFAQDDVRQRGYYTRPYLRYEAEAGDCVQKCVTNGEILPITYNQQAVQSEASNQSAINLVEQGDFVQWTNEQEADGLTIRFSLPDSIQTDTLPYYSAGTGVWDTVYVTHGAGIQGEVALYVNDNFVQNITLDSYWAWQYFLNSSPNIPDNKPPTLTGTAKFARMRFDEIHVKLAQKIPANASFKLVKADNNSNPYTIDFVELENMPAPVLFSDIADENKVAYNPATDGTINTFISANGGKTIYIPTGKFESAYDINLAIAGTKIIGAGMWHTEIFFNASSDRQNTFNRRGVKLNSANLVIEGLSLNTINNKRYYNNNSGNQVGKGIFGGTAAVNCVVKNVRAEHFECGAWIDGADNLLVQNCRFTNNYADGINLSYGTKNSVVEYCLFRNNGDDDMATWSRSNRECSNNTFRYCTAEHNWRASSLGFFGGKQNTAHHIVVIDGMEAGIRANCDFAGSPFSADGNSEFHDISIYRGGCASGARGVSGDLWGTRTGAMHLNASNQYDLKNFLIYNIDLYNSKDNAVFIGSGSKNFNEVYLRNINVLSAKNNGIYFNNAKGNIKYCDLTFKNVVNANNTDIPSNLAWEQENTSCQVTDLGDEEITLPSEFDLLSPAHQATLTNANVTFSWQESTDVENIAGYEFYLDYLLKATTSETSIVVNVANGNHSWYVKAINCNGNNRQSSATFNFVMDAPILAVETIENNKSFLVFPNPSKDIFNIKTDENISEIQVFDITGKNILQKNVIEKEFIINLSVFSNGVYFLLAKSEKGIFVNKLIKQ
ncbi:MAG: T9SS type A sorting domain-containing protein [Prevotellaceae bacterium]|jgi:hypothetical protein|nr:T9SS type A sorting domain-containing protein [Prevotellaceae bacterium]